MKYFCEILPIKEDIKRHREHEEQLLKQIEEVEYYLYSQEDKKLISSTYIQLLSKLRQNKAELVSRIGK